MFTALEESLFPVTYKNTLKTYLFDQAKQELEHSIAGISAGFKPNISYLEQNLTLIFTHQKIYIKNNFVNINWL